MFDFEDNWGDTEECDEYARDCWELDQERAVEAIGYFAAQRPTPWQKYETCKALCDFFRAMAPEDDIPF